MTLGQFLFKYRSYAPIPWVIVMIIFATPTPTSLVAGFLVACAGECLRAWGVMYAGSETRVTGSGVGASRLVTSGPFSHTRNPLYIGNMLIYTGIGIMSYALFPWLQLGALCWFVFQYSLIVRDEEAFLRRQFGAEYEAYVRAVPRFFFRLTRYTPPVVITIDWKAGWHSEQRTIQAFVLASAIVFVLWLIR